MQLVNMSKLINTFIENETARQTTLSHHGCKQSVTEQMDLDSIAFAPVDELCFKCMVLIGMQSKHD